MVLGSGETVVRIYSKMGWLLTVALLLTGCDAMMEAKPAGGEIPIHFTDLQPGPDCRFNVKVENDEWALEYFTFFLTEPRIKIEGKWLPLKFKQTPWQTPDVARFEFHHGCTTESNNTVIRLDANADLMARATILRLTMGLPEPLSREPIWDAPFSNEDMFISDLYGHNFMRLELNSRKDPTVHWKFGLASSQCAYKDGESGAVMCQRPNRVTVDLPMAQNVIDLRLLGSVAQMLFRANLYAQPECHLAHSSAPNCEKVLRNLTSRAWLRWDAPDKVYMRN